MYRQLHLNTLVVLILLITAAIDGQATALPTPDKSDRTVQDWTVNGTVRDEKGNTLTGVSITLRGTQRGTVSDAAGKYQLTVAEGTTLIFSSVGYQPQEVVVGRRNVIDVVLLADARDLDEVVVVGYGTVRKRDLTGAVSQIGSKEVTQVITTSVDQALAGRAAGVQVTQNSSQPGGGVSIRVRGGNSIQGGNEPLYVIDGIPIGNESGSVNPGASNAPAVNPLATLNTNDIESIEILKDASATAIYGARGANGVVIITTKRGKEGRSTVSFDAYYGTQRAIRLLPMLNAREYATLANEANVNGGRTAPYSQQQIDALPAEGPNLQDSLFRTAPIQNYQLSMSGGTERTQYYLSGNYFQQDGIVRNSSFNRAALRFNLDHKISAVFKAGTSVTLSKSTANQVFSDGGRENDGQTSVITAALSWNPTAPLYNANGSYNRANPNIPVVGNPLAIVNETENSTTTLRALANTYIDARFLKNFVFRTTFGFDILSAKNPFYLGSQAAPDSYFGVARMAHRYTSMWLTENTLTFTQAFGRHALTVLAGVTAQRSVTEGFSASSQNFVSDVLEYNNLAAGRQINAPGSFVTDWGLLSYIGRVNYAFNDKYLLTATVRRDGSSRFGGNNKYATFPSASLAWRLSDEPFLKEVKALSELKARVSYGLTGNQDIGQYLSLALLGQNRTIFNGQAAIGFSPARLANPDLQWEPTAQFDAGLDLELLNRRISLTADYYVKNTSDLLLNVQLPWSTGFEQITQNLGRTRNRGLELTLNTRNVVGAFQWTTALNYSQNRNQVTDIGSAPFILSGANALGVTDGGTRNTMLIRVGEPLGSFYGYRSAGLFQSQAEVDASAQKTAKPGDRRYVDLDNNGVLDGNDRTVIGTALPKFIAGVDNRFSYQGFELNVLLQAVYGNKIFNHNRISLENLNGTANQLRRTLDRWRPDNPATDVARATTGTNLNGEFSDYFLEDGSFLRLRNVTLAYNLPKTLLNRLKVQTIRVYTSGQNLLTRTRYTGYDPEVSRYGGSNVAPGHDQGGYPAARTVTVGLNVTF